MYLAIDLGASSGRTVLGRLDGDRLYTEEVHRFRTPMREDGDHLYWDLAALEAEVAEGLRRGLAAGPVRSVSVDAWGVDYVPLGADGAPLRDPYSYRDPRTEGLMEEAFRRVPPAEIYAATGIQFMPINTLYQVLADLAHEPALAARTATRLCLADYLHYRLSGRLAAERTMASTTQLLDVHTGAWAAGLMQRLGIDPAGWPPVVAPGTDLGPLRSSFRGAAQGPPPRVVAGCAHDTASAVAAVPAEGAGAEAAGAEAAGAEAAGAEAAGAEAAGTWAYLSSGTWSLLGVERATPVLTDAAREASFTNEAGLDGTIRFLKNITGLWVLEECARAWREAGEAVDYGALMREADAAPPSPGLVDVDDARFAARGDMPGMLRAACREAGLPAPEGRGPLVRLILDSLAARYASRLGLLERLTGTSVARLYVVGGGARNALLNQLTADACGRAVVAGPAEATAWGNLLVQARTLGDLPRGLSIRDVVRRSAPLQTFTPRLPTPSH